MRHEDWQTRLSAYLEEMRNVPFDFPNHNCMLLGFGAVKAVTELDLAPNYVGKLSSEQAGALALRKVDNVKTVEEVFLKHLGGEFQPIAFARPGDLVFISDNNTQFELPLSIRLFGPVPGICYGITSFFAGEDGLIEFPTLMADKTLWVS